VALDYIVVVVIRLVGDDAGSAILRHTNVIRYRDHGERDQAADEDNCPK